MEDKQQSGSDSVEELAEAFTSKCEIASLQQLSTTSAKKMAQGIGDKDVKIEVRKQIQKFQPPSAEVNQITAPIKRPQHFPEASADRRLKIEVKNHPFRQIMRAKNLCYEEFIEDFKTPTELSLAKILGKLGIEFYFRQYRNDPMTVWFSTRTETPFTLMAAGENYQEAKQKVIRNAILNLKDILQFEM